MSTWVNLLEILYPVGSFYLSNVDISPASKIGGTWTKVENAALRGASSTGYTGSDSITLSFSQMPTHSHSVTVKSAGAHDHNIYYSTTGVRSGSYWQAVTEGAAHDGSSSAYFNGKAGSHTHDTTCASVGGGEPHSVVQRSYNCYIWYRTA